MNETASCCLGFLDVVVLKYLKNRRCYRPYRNMQAYWLLLFNGEGITCVSTFWHSRYIPKLSVTLSCGWRDSFEWSFLRCSPILRIVQFPSSYSFVKVDSSIYVRYLQLCFFIYFLKLLLPFNGLRYGLVKTILSP